MKFIDSLRISTVVTISLVMFIVIGFLFKGPGYSDQYFTLVSIASFLFGIYVAFSIASRHSNLSEINEILKTDEAILLSIYQLSEVFGDEVQKNVKKLIDNYLIDQIDYFLEDFKYSSASFLALFNYMVSLEAKNKKNEIVYEKIIDSLLESSKNRKRVETFTQDKMAVHEWLSILILLALIVFFIFQISNGSITSIVTSAFLSTSAVTLVIVLRDLNNLRWKEGRWIWEPLDNLFHALGLLPYYPKDMLGSRVKIKKGQEIRIAEYPNPYPDMSGKVVKEIIT